VIVIVKTQFHNNNSLAYTKFIPRVTSRNILYF